MTECAEENKLRTQTCTKPGGEKLLRYYKKHERLRKSVRYVQSSGRSEPGSDFALAQFAEREFRLTQTAAGRRAGPAPASVHLRPATREGSTGKNKVEDTLYFPPNTEGKGRKMHDHGVPDVERAAGSRATLSRSLFKCKQRGCGCVGDAAAPSAAFGKEVRSGLSFKGTAPE
ncbi:hypothetical protein WMY93_017306 [Mugilogobius chulae]|uniref:Uncharacterized protein n=1 Tax=Mugilogobius chulae TaxID=88201 RepID=A0AAW0P002_9GOBI